MYYTSSSHVVPKGIGEEVFLWQVKPLLKSCVASACFPDADELLPKDVDVVPILLRPGSDGGPVSFELEAHGTPARKAKFGTFEAPTAAMMALREGLVEALASWSAVVPPVLAVQTELTFLRDTTNRILRVKWVDQDGPHV
jgi:hypothetical protein